MTYPLFQGLSLLLLAALVGGCLLVAHVARWAHSRLPVVRRVLADHRALRQREARK